METPLTALVLGAFDICHWGHLDFLLRAGDYGTVTVGLSSDELLVETKRKPVVCYDERKWWLERFGYTVLPRGSQDAKPLFQDVKPEVYVCGSDWIGTPHIQDMGISTTFLNEQGITVIYLPRDHELSTTRIIDLVRRSA